MKLLLRFLKPYKGLIAATALALLLDVAGALFIPTILAEMINIGTTESGEAVSTAYYSVQGERVGSSYRGVVIEVKTMADGTKNVRKTIRK